MNPSQYDSAGSTGLRQGWNACLDEVARLNPCRAQSVQRCQCCGYLVTESEHRGCLRSAAVAVPDGYVMVPVKPTPEMLEELTNGDIKKSALAKLRYKAMLAAAPSANHAEQNLDMVPDGWVCGNCGSNVQTRLDDGAQQKESDDE